MLVAYVTRRSDGGGGVYFGPATSKGAELTLAKPSSGSQPGGAVCVLSGTGTGECRRVVSAQSNPSPAPAPGAAKPLGAGSVAMLQPCTSATALRFDLPTATNNFSIVPVGTTSKLELCVLCDPPGHGSSSTGCGKNSYFEPLEFQLGDTWMTQYGTAAFQWKQAEGQLTLTKGGGKCVGPVKTSAGATIGMQACSGASKWSYDSSAKQLRVGADSVLDTDAPPLCLGFGDAPSGPVR